MDFVTGFIFFSMALKYPHILFDLDRTLWDFEKNSRETLQELSSEIGCAIVQEQFDTFYDYYLKVNAQLWSLYRNGSITKDFLRVERFRRALAKFGISDKSKAEEWAHEYVLRSPLKTHLMPHAVEVLEYLRLRGYVMHIASNGFPEVQHKKLQQCNLTSYFENIFLSEELGSRKPELPFFLRIMRRLGLPNSQLLMVGDDYHADIEGARNAGIDQIYFAKSSWDEEGKSATYVIRCLCELKKIL